MNKTNLLDALYEHQKIEMINYVSKHRFERLNDFLKNKDYSRKQRRKLIKKFKKDLKRDIEPLYEISRMYIHRLLNKTGDRVGKKLLYKKFKNLVDVIYNRHKEDYIKLVEKEAEYFLPHQKNQVTEKRKEKKCAS